MPIIHWDPPTTLGEARARRRDLIAKIEDIETQLGDRKKKDDMGKADWGAWSQSAKWARVHALQELRLLKDWIHDNRAAPFLIEQELRTSKARVH